MINYLKKNWFKIIFSILWLVIFFRDPLENYNNAIILMSPLIIKVIVDIFLKEFNQNYSNLFYWFAISIIFFVFVYRYNIIKNINIPKWIFHVSSIIALSFTMLSLLQGGIARWIKKGLNKIPSHYLIRKIAVHNEYFIITLFILIVYPIALYFILNDYNKKITYDILLSIAYTIAGILITSLVYFKLTNKTTSLKEYLSTSIDILESSLSEDKVYIITPTLFVGHDFSKSLHGRYKNQLLETIGKKWVLATLNIPWEKFINGFNIKDFKSKFYNSLIGNEETEISKAIECFKEFTHKNNNGVNFLESSCKEEGTVFDFHQAYVPIINNMSDEKRKKIAKHHSELIEFYYALSIKKNIATFNFLTWEYCKKSKNGSNYKSNFFAVANVTQGRYYLGEYKIFDKKEQEFHGTYFENKNIKDSMLAFFTAFIKEKAPTNGTTTEGPK